MAIIIIALIFWGRKEWADDWVGKSKVVWVAYLTSLAHAVTIPIVDIIFKPFAYWLTRFENQRTKSKFEASYVLKLFVFRFFNNYGSLAYIAFSKKSAVGCINVHDYTFNKQND